MSTSTGDPRSLTGAQLKQIAKADEWSKHVEAHPNQPATISQVEGLTDGMLEIFNSSTNGLRASSGR